MICFVRIIYCNYSKVQTQENESNITGLYYKKPDVTILQNAMDLIVLKYERIILY